MLIHYSSVVSLFLLAEPSQGREFSALPEETNGNILLRRESSKPVDTLYEAGIY